MPDLQALLDQIHRLDQQATPGPWHVAPEEEDEDGSKFPWAIFGPKNDLWGPQGWDDKHYIPEIPEMTMDDAEFIALARTALPQLAKVLQAVLAKCASMERGVGYRVSGQHDTWDSYHEGMSDMAGYIEETITDTLEGAD